jgi:hypothetical protein
MGLFEKECLHSLLTVELQSKLKKAKAVPLHAMKALGGRGV